MQNASCTQSTASSASSPSRRATATSRARSARAVSERTESGSTFVRFRTPGTRSDTMIEAADDTFAREVLEAKGTVLVDFGATWCPPCKVLKPIVESIARERAGSLKVVYVDMDAAPKTVQQCGVRAAPTLVVYKTARSARSTSARSQRRRSSSCSSADTGWHIASA